MLGFTRRERLDVKKPGPAALYKPQDSAFEERRGIPLMQLAYFKYISIIWLLYSIEMITPKIKKVFHPSADHGPHSVDTDYAYVQFHAPYANTYSLSNYIYAF